MKSISRFAQGSMNGEESGGKESAIVALSLCVLMNVFVRDRHAFFDFLTDHTVLSLAVFSTVVSVVLLLVYRLWRAKERSLFEPVCCFTILTVFTLLMLSARALPAHYRIAAWIVIGSVGILAVVWILRSSHDFAGILTSVAMAMVGIAVVSTDLSYNTNTVAFSDYLFVWLLFSAPRIAIFVCAVLAVFRSDA